MVKVKYKVVDNVEVEYRVGWRLRMTVWIRTPMMSKRSRLRRLWWGQG